MTPEFTPRPSPLALGEQERSSGIANEELWSFHERPRLAVRTACRYLKVVVVSRGIALLLIDKEEG